MDNIKETVEFFNSCASNWDENQNNTKEDLTNFLSFLPIKKNDKVLDVACGTGVITDILFSKSQTEVDAIDVSDKMIEKAKEKNKNSKLHFENINYYDVNKKYNAVIVFNAYPHFVDIESFVNKSYELLEDKGYLVVTHNLSRKQLDECHKHVSSSISRSLKSVEQEYESFKDKFNAIRLSEDDKSYIIVLQKK